MVLVVPLWDRAAGVGTLGATYALTPSLPAGTPVAGAASGGPAAVDLGASAGPATRLSVDQVSTT
ncbi:hypothetical protein OG689_35410 [Kitasatospora sp. NBC_00240]|uniref:hypothetical protein n=1 Tax=Kitasatospora sp. NBC_00240 TaxID=2903567 RepID=UPI002259DA68|nr:hypothetical protein [Kitasatospora sp. NBC_00240]MCX5214488.1 hypothetical protein [Kitasatospora sp. NBC_00240]